MEHINRDSLDHFKNIFQDCNINFLIGSGLSVPYFSTLGKIEIWLTDLEESFTDGLINFEQYNYLKASIYKIYFDVAIKNNGEIIRFKENFDDYVKVNPKDDEKTQLYQKLKNTYLSYKIFFKSLNSLLYERRSNTVTKQVNIFTTNVDVFVEKIFEDLDIQFNDGFSGIFKKIFSLSNFKKSFYQKSLQYDNISEIPVFNLLKLHGSVTWKKDKGSILFSTLRVLKEIKLELDKIELLDISEIADEVWEEEEREPELQDFIDKIEEDFEDGNNIPDVQQFVDKYDELQIVNPTKEKFRDTTFNKNYYELLRLYANELEKENTILFVLGFSMADEHIREITKRAIKSNPTLKIFIVSYSKEAQDIKNNFRSDGIDIRNYQNVEILNPEDNFDLRQFNEKVMIPILKEVELHKTNSTN